MSLTGRLVRVIADYDNPRSLGSHLRAKRIAPLLNMIEAAHVQYGYVTLIDVGGTESYWNIVPSGFLDEHDVSITVVNIPGAPLPDDHGRFTFVEADGCDLGRLGDDSFHIAHSNSVIEHVGSRDRMVAFARETARVAPLYYVQTPNYWFPIEPHFMAPFFHWLPKALQEALVLRFPLGNRQRAETREEATCAVESVHLLRRSELQALFETAHITTEKLLGLPKSLIAIKE